MNDKLNDVARLGAWDFVGSAPRTIFCRLRELGRSELENFCGAGFLVAGVADAEPGSTTSTTPATTNVRRRAGVSVASTKVPKLDADPTRIAQSHLEIGGRRKTSGGKSLAIAIAVLALGCGAPGEKKDKDFFTSGSHEADQRADQRMVKSEQLAGGDTGVQTKGGAIGKLAQAENKKSLYEELGGDGGITLLVDDFMPRALADPRVNWAREGVSQGGFSVHHWSSVTWNASPENVAQLKKHMVQFIALATGGPSVYEGKQMEAAHAGLHITNAEFDATVGDIKASLDKLKVPNKIQKELLSIIESTRPQVAAER